jgi:DNA polymerase-1
MGAKGLAVRLDITEEEALNLMDMVFKKFPKIELYINNTVQEARQSARQVENKGIGLVKTELGRKRHLSDIIATNGRRRHHAERQAINFKIQATCHDIITNIIIDMDREIQAKHSGALLFNQVHDSVLYYVPKAEVKEFITWAKPVMEKPRLNTDLKFPVDIEVYEKCWGGKRLKF